MNPIAFDNSYARLPERFHSRMSPTAVTAPAPITINRELAQLLGIDPDWLASQEGTAMVAGNSVVEGADPIATVYAGHQFGGFNPQLGDGRALLLGEILATNGKRYDLQLKGSGPTPYSRGGDGRSPLGPVIREYIVSEAMYHLGVPTTRALAAVATGDPVYREQALPGAVLARVASSHIRIGTFEFFAARKDVEGLQALCDHVIERHYPEAQDAENPVLAMLQSIIKNLAELVAKWQLLGFIHGVMNTDNMLVCGETVDYGPCAFMDAFDPDQVYSSIDHQSRYAYRNQPSIAHWNLSVLAQSLLPVIDEDQEKALALAQEAINQYQRLFMEAHTWGLAPKLGLAKVTEADTALVEDLWTQLAQEKLDFTLSFRRLADLANPEASARETVASLFEFPEAMQPWLARWQSRLKEESCSSAERQISMDAANPAFIPRNHLVEAAIDAATNKGDLSPFHQLVEALAQPHTYRADLALLATPPRSEEIVRETFCGT